MLRARLGDVRDDERRAAARHLERDAAERVEVGAPVDLRRVAPLLGRHVRRRAHRARRARRDAGERTGQLRDAEVEDLDAFAARQLAIGDEEDVVGLEIAMRDAGVVRGIEHARDLAADLAELAERERAPRAMRCASVSPSRYSMIRYACPS